MEFEIPPEGQERLDRCETDDVCCACEEPFVGDETRQRGMHERCCKATWKQIKLGNTTEQERIEQGKMRPRAAPGRNPSNPVTKELSGKKS